MCAAVKLKNSCASLAANNCFAAALDSSNEVLATVKFNSTTFSTLSIALLVKAVNTASCASKLALVAAENCSGNVNIVTSK